MKTIPATAAPLPPPVVHRPQVEGDEREALIYQWQGGGAGIIAFSHGNLSAPASYTRLISHWLERGFDVWAPLHVDSRQHPRTDDFTGLATWKARIEDMRATSSLIAAPYVAAGHSYGALSALVLGGAGGEIPGGIAQPLRDAHARCVIALSPPPPFEGLVVPGGYAQTQVPALIQTGSRDVFPGDADGPDAWRVHLPAYEEAAPGGHRYLLLLDGVDHYFGSAICELEREEPAQLDLLAITLDVCDLFIDAYFSPADETAHSDLHTRLTDKGPVTLSMR